MRGVSCLCWIAWLLIDAPRHEALAEPTVEAMTEGTLTTSPEKVESGQSVVIELNEASACVWQVQPSGTRWISGRREQGSFVALLDLSPGRYFVSCVCFEKKRHETVAIDVGPGAPLPPDPAPGRFGLTKEVMEWVTSSVSTEDRSMSGELAKSFRTIQSAMAAGTLKQPAEILRETLQSNNRALGSRVEGWRGWGSRLESRLSQLHAESKLRTVEDYREAWGEIAAGLERVRGR
jgi:hypothetical protein